MQIKVNQKSQREGGSTLIISLMVIFIIGIATGSYLSLVVSQNQSVMRSMAWNAAVPSMEAGVEEALAHLRFGGITNLAGNGWTPTSDGWFQKSGNLGGGFGYVVRIEPVEPPNILATGVASTPFGPGVIAPTSGAVLRALSDRENFVRRSVRVPTRRNHIFTHAMVAKETIDLAGRNITTDSFDSLDPMHSTGGKYDPIKRKDNGDVATNSRITDSLNIGNARIMGSVATGPGGSTAFSAHGSVGDTAWVASGQTGIQPGRDSGDMNASFPDVEAPFSGGVIPPSGEVDGKHYDYVLGDGDYYLADLTGSMLVTGNARVYVRSRLNVGGEDHVMITPTANLQMFVAAPSASLGGSGVVNENGSALSFQYYGLPTNTKLSFGGNAGFVGAIYAPQAYLHLGGGGEDTFDFAGSCIVDTIRMNGHFNFHYDEALKRIGPDHGYIADGWNEVDPLVAMPLLAAGGQP
jgi:hypothetical protein